MFDMINLLEGTTGATGNDIYAILVLQALQTRLKRYPLYTDPVFTLATSYT